MKKKWLLRLAAVMSALAAFILCAAPALAIWDWCAFDPQLEIEGHKVDLKVSILAEPQEVDKLIIGNMVFLVAVPRGTDAEVVFCEKKTRVKVVETSWLRPGRDGSIPVSVTLTAMARERRPLKLEILLDDVMIAELEGTTKGILNYRLLIQ